MVLQPFYEWQVNMNPEDQSRSLAECLGIQQVIPLIEINDRNAAGELANLLVDEGLPVIEVVLRTMSALDCIEQMALVNGCTVGVGSVTSLSNFHDAVDAGAGFVVSPGTSKLLFDVARDSPIPMLPGAMTASEVMDLQDVGFNLVKLFPASQSGGIGYLRALSGPLPRMRFCPTGGINEQNLTSYLELDNVHCVGGSWVTPARLIANNDWVQITSLVRNTRMMLERADSG